MLVKQKSIICTIYFIIAALQFAQMVGETDSSLILVISQHNYFRKVQPVMPYLLLKGEKYIKLGCKLHTQSASILCLCSPIMQRTNKLECLFCQAFTLQSSLMFVEKAKNPLKREGAPVDSGHTSKHQARVKKAFQDKRSSLFTPYKAFSPSMT